MLSGVSNCAAISDCHRWTITGGHWQVFWCGWGRFQLTIDGSVVHVGRIARGGGGSRQRWDRSHQSITIVAATFEAGTVASYQL